MATDQIREAKGNNVWTAQLNNWSTNPYQPNRRLVNIYNIQYVWSPQNGSHLMTPDQNQQSATWADKQLFPSSRDPPFRHLLKTGTAGSQIDQLLARLQCFPGVSQVFLTQIWMMWWIHLNDPIEFHSNSYIYMYIYNKLNMKWHELFETPSSMLHFHQEANRDVRGLCSSGVLQKCLATLLGANIYILF